MEPVKPKHLNPFAAAFLERLQGQSQAEQFVLGGYFALKHYLDYRETGDVDAWWRSREDPHALAAAREAFMQTAAEFGYSVRERTWGETISLEAFDGGNKAFSFQVSVRTVEIDPPVASPWGRFPIETLDDNVASKMMALVARGAPRDFVDIKEIVDSGLLTIDRCWQLWNAKRPGIEIEDARLRVKMHLATIEARRPIERIPAAERPAAERLRAWYRDVFTARRDELGPGVGDVKDEDLRQ
ncbi:MAG: nucleotidyl transferase AbiEii/AbiGii toxin family protein [Candidatus Eremiobacteraeota bacterium]|nr:nucleotidyl transferase AbiEii/AbiGii toxin family protein [Candidatus Eremiobacteraeota bacterium]